MAAAGLQPFHWELEFPTVFFAAGMRRPDAGFDVILGNPPYDVLSDLESGHDLSALRAAIAAEPSFRPSVRGKNNLYKVFVCRALDLLADGGRFGFIVPMAILGDDQAAALRAAMLEAGRFTDIDSFPQKDSRERRVFRDAKLSTAAFLYRKGTDGDGTFALRVHPGRDLDEVSADLSLATDDIPLYDPANLSIVSCDQSDWSLAVRLLKSGRMGRLGDVAESFQGEVNETNVKKKRGLSRDSADGPLILRGAAVCMYAVRRASQGVPYFLRRDVFLEGASPDSKAHHHRHRRVGFQRSSPQNNFRRIIAAPIGPDHFLFDTVSYVPEHKSTAPLSLLLAFLNAKLPDWYFRLGSTNSKVGEYQFNNLPFPRFSPEAFQADVSGAAADLPSRLTPAEVTTIVAGLESELAEPPFGPRVVRVIAAAADRITAIELSRGEIARSARSRLAPAAQPFQDLIDQLFFRLAGLSDQEAAALEQRLCDML